MNSPELRAEATDSKDINRRLNKQDLIQLISSTIQILDQPVSEINDPLLPPTRYVPVKLQVNESKQQRRNEIREIEEMLGLRELMQIAKPKVLRLTRENRRTRVMIIFNCEMVKKELFNENVELLNPYFQGYIIENLEETDESEDTGDLRRQVHRYYSRTNS